MNILGEIIKVKEDYIDIDTLKFLEDNPRVYACIHAVSNFDEMSEEEQQNKIYEELLKQPSVKNLKPEIKRHGGLMEPIVVRWDTMTVIEGNSRLAVYRELNKDEKESGEWNLIRCDIVSSLTDEQQAAFLNQIHVKGKTSWSAYEKANFAYVTKQRGKNYGQIAELFGESEQTIRTRIKVIKMMADNSDIKLSHFSYYDVLVRNANLSREIKGNENLKKKLLKDIAKLGSDEESNSFTAQELRNKLPVVWKKPKVLKKYNEGVYDLDQAYQLAKTSSAEEKVKKARDLLEYISKPEISELEQNRFNAFQHALRKLSKTVTRIQKIADHAKENK